jgi:hypothetical protein
MSERPRTSEKSGIRQGSSLSPAIKRLGWGFMVGATITILPGLASKLNNVVLLLVSEILGWPGALLALVLGGWNSRPFTVSMYYSANLALYIGLTYFFLSRREKRKREKQLEQEDSRF